MRKILFLLVLGVLAASVFAQNRKDIILYIPNPDARIDQSVFFKEKFEREVVVAGYTLTRNVNEADFLIRLSVKPNMILYDDGILEPAPPDEEQFKLWFYLIRMEDNKEILSFSFAFSEPEEMNDYYLVLINEAMANVPQKIEVVEVVEVPPVVIEKPIEKPVVVVIEEIEEPVIVERDDWWRNKMLYIRLSAEWAPSIFHSVEERKSNKWYIPSAVLGLEFQFLNWMSVEALGKMNFQEINSDDLDAAAAFAIKFPIKPGIYSMIEPYLEGDYLILKDNDIEVAYKFQIGGGFQVGIKSGSSSVLFFDTNIFYNVGDIQANAKDSDDKFWRKYLISIGVGLKFGFVNRK